MRNQAPDYAMNVSSTDRDRMSKYSSLKIFGNPYGDYANMTIINLNIAWRARRIIAEMSNLTNGTVSEPFKKEIAEIDASIKKSVAYLEQHKKARPYHFSVFTGYQYDDLSSTKWEGHFSNL